MRTQDMPDPTNQTPDASPIPPAPGAVLPLGDPDAAPTAGDPNSDPIPSVTPVMPSPQEGDSTGEVPAPPALPGS